jgi:hypothetical protein
MGKTEMHLLNLPLKQKYHPPMSRTVSETSYSHIARSTLKKGSKRINQYNLTEKIGKGAYGEVFKAID